MSSEILTSYNIPTWRKSKSVFSLLWQWFIYFWQRTFMFWLLEVLIYTKESKIHKFDKVPILAPSIIDSQILKKIHKKKIDGHFSEQSRQKNKKSILIYQYIWRITNIKSFFFNLLIQANRPFKVHTVF